MQNTNLMCWLMSFLGGGATTTELRAFWVALGRDQALLRGYLGPHMMQRMATNKLKTGAMWLVDCGVQVDDRILRLLNHGLYKLRKKWSEASVSV